MCVLLYSYGRYRLHILPWATVDDVVHHPPPHPGTILTSFFSHREGKGKGAKDERHTVGIDVTLSPSWKTQSGETKTSSQGGEGVVYNASLKGGSTTSSHNKPRRLREAHVRQTPR